MTREQQALAVGTLSLVAYVWPWRWVAALLFGWSRAVLPLLLFFVVGQSDPPVTPPLLARLLLLLAILPGLAAWLVERAFSATAEVRSGLLVVSRRGFQVEIPCVAIAGVAVWRVPLPRPGLGLQMRSGRRLRYSFQPGNATALLSELAAAAIPGTELALSHPTAVYAASPAPRPRWYHLLGKFNVFALGPAAVLFYTHQHIAYGGPLGEYYMYGLAAYLATFSAHWLTVTAYLVLYASLWRGLAEAAVLLCAWSAPASTSQLRRAMEVFCRAGYYGGVPVLLALRYLG